MGQSFSRTPKSPTTFTLPPQHVHSTVKMSFPKSNTALQTGTVPRPTKKTRFVCVSDTHNLSPYNGAFKIPKGDVLIHAGDMTKQGTYKELKKTLEWIDRLVKEGVVERAIIIAGNHELTLDLPFYEAEGHNWHNQDPQSPAECLALFSSENLHPNVTFLNHSSAHITLTSPTGPRTHFTVFGSPHTPLRSTKLSETDSTRWAFQYEGYPSDESQDLWQAIPENMDILITHTPPYNHLDGYPINLGKGTAESHCGCEALRQACWRVRPKLHIFGHFHEGRGVERVLWRDGKHVVGMEEGFKCSHTDKDGDMDMSTGNEDHDDNEMDWMEWVDPGAADDRVSGKMSIVDATSRTRMFGGIGLRDGETLMVNPSIVRGNWPYKGVNKAIVVDIELEVWE